MTTSQATIETAEAKGSRRQRGVRLRVVPRGAAIAPLRLGVPLPRGFASDDERWIVEGARRWRCQTRVLAHWPDGSAKWLLAEFPLDEEHAAQCGEGPELQLRPCAGETEWAELEGGPCVVAHSVSAGGDRRVAVSTGAVKFLVAAGGDRLLEEAEDEHGAWLGGRGCRLCLTDAKGRRREARVEKVSIVDAGPWRASVAVAGSLGRGTGLRFEGLLSFFAGQRQVRVELTAQNPRRARHAGGYWDLGDAGSVLLTDLSLEIETAAGSGRAIGWRESADAAVRTATSERLEIYQDSSGGENWQSRNHVNREGRVPPAFRGYRVRCGEQELRGERAEPVAALTWNGGYAACAVEEFWQQFPSALEVDGGRIVARIWPRQFDDLHELQAGEHNTRVVWIDFGREAEAACERLSSVFDPPRAAVDSTWIAGSGAVPWFPSPEVALRDELRLVLGEAIEGEHSLPAKRETIDEYGWRNFGDCWADHEAAYSDDPRPVISHYNNQYDLLHGLLAQYLAGGDERWWRLADPLARHVLDIDIYHTDRDKSGYSGGPFWHTAHYHDAGRSTHRAMSTDMLGKKIPAPGTGPCNEHNYTSGLLLYHYLTGCERARRAVIGLADWVIAMDDGRRHVLGVLSGLPTGDASRTRESNYYGPGRGAANSINALLDAWQLSRRDVYFRKAVELIRRSIHPDDDLESLDLGNAELRWSYTVFLQALARFLELTDSVEEFAEARAYARDSLLHYARWMAAHEALYLEKPEELEFPTETWSAQDLRKGTVLQMAAQYASADEAKRFRERGREILDGAWRSLMSFESRRCTRPVALVLQQGYLEAFLSNDETAAPVELGGHRWRERTPFVSQKDAIRRAVRSPAGALRIMASAANPFRWIGAARQLWWAERIRHLTLDR